MAKCRVIVVEKEGKYYACSKVAFTPEQEPELDEMSNGKTVAISLAGEGEWLPVGRDFVEVLQEQAERKARELGADRLYWVYGEKK